MGIQVTATASGTTEFYRRDKRGNVVKVDVDRSEYVTPTSGQYRLALYGMSEPFQFTSPQFGESTKVRLEWQVKRGKRTYVDGLFSDMHTLSLGAKSNLGKLARALIGRDISEGETIELTDLLGLELDGTVKQETKPDKTGQLRTYSNVVVDSVMPVDDEEDDDDDGEPAPAPKAKKKNPFQLDEDDE